MLIYLMRENDSFPWLRQLPPDHLPHTFTVNPADPWDALVVYESLPASILIPAHKAALLITGEPPSIKSYPKGFIRQFDAVLTSQRRIRHPLVRYSQQALPWFIGAHLDPPLRYSDLRDLHPQKTAFLSTVCSSKARTPGHRARLAFTQALQTELGDLLCVYGRGHRPVADKAEAILPYRFHLVIENERVDDYWTEKLADAFLGESFPIYSGAPNIYQYFPERSLIAFDHTHPSSVHWLAQQIRSGAIHRLVDTDALREAKRRILERYNLFPTVAEWLSTLPAQVFHNSPRSLHPESYFCSLPRRWGRFLKSKLSH